MDLIFSVVSIVKDVNHKDKQFRNLTTQLNYVLQKAQNIDKKYQTDSYIQVYLKSVIKRGQETSKKMSQLFQAQNISIRQRVRLSLPFDKTKQQIKELIELLQKGSNDLKQYIQENMNEANGVKRKLKKQSLQIQQNKQATSHEIENQQSHMDMGPTINDDHLIQQKFVEISVELMGDPAILELIGQQAPDILKFYKKINIEDHHQILLYTVARKNFTKCYKPLKTICPEIDKLSKDSHFQIIWRRKHADIHNQLLDTKKHTQKKNSSQSNRPSQLDDQFFSFPDQGANNRTIKGVVLLIKSQQKTSFVMEKNEWKKCQTQTQITNGDMISGFLSKKENNQYCPLYYQVKYSLPN